MAGQRQGRSKRAEKVGHPVRKFQSGLHLADRNSADLSDGVKSHAQDMETSDDGGQSDEDWPTQGGTDDDVLVEIKDILCDEITYTTGYFTALGTFFDVKFEQCIRENVIFKDCQMLGVHFIDCSIYDVS